MSLIAVDIDCLQRLGVEVLPRGTGREVNLPRHTVLEAPCSLKWSQFEHSLELGAFSYQVSGFCSAARIGRYCSFGEAVQIGRQNHPTDWVSTSPLFYLGDRVFGLGGGFSGAEGYHGYRMQWSKGPPTRVRKTMIGNDVWIGHGAHVVAGVSIGDGAIVAANATVAKDVPPYAVVAGNPAVVKKYRFPEPLVARMQASRWWRFAPWQMAHLDPSTPERFLDGTAALSEAPFRADVLDLRQPLPNADPAGQD